MLTVKQHSSSFTVYGRIYSSTFPFVVLLSSGRSPHYFFSVICWISSVGPNTRSDLFPLLHTEEAQAPLTEWMEPVEFNWGFSLPVIVSIMSYSHRGLCYITSTCPHSQVWVNHWRIIECMGKCLMKALLLGGARRNPLFLCETVCHIHITF